MHDLDLSRTKQYLMHLSKSYDTARRKAEQQGYHPEKISGNVKRNDLDFGLHELETRLRKAMSQGDNLMEYQEREDLRITRIKAKMKVVEERLDQFLKISQVKRIKENKKREHYSKNKLQQNKKRRRENRNPPHERIALMKVSLQNMRIELSKVKKMNVDQEQVIYISRRIAMLHNRINLLEKNPKR